MLAIEIEYTYFPVYEGRYKVGGHFTFFDLFGEYRSDRESTQIFHFSLAEFVVTTQYFIFTQQIPPCFSCVLQWATHNNLNYSVSGMYQMQT